MSEDFIWKFLGPLLVAIITGLAIISHKYPNSYARLAGFLMIPSMLISTVLIGADFGYSSAIATVQANSENLTGALSSLSDTATTLRVVAWGFTAFQLLLLILSLTKYWLKDD